MKSFPVWIFLVPVMIGITIQTMKYEISIAWASIAVALAGVMTALKNNINEETMDAFINRIDQKMYEDKRAYYENIR